MTRLGWEVGWTEEASGRVGSRNQAGRSGTSPPLGRSVNEHRKGSGSGNTPSKRENGSKGYPRFGAISPIARRTPPLPTPLHCGFAAASQRHGLRQGHCQRTTNPPSGRLPGHPCGPVAEPSQGPCACATHLPDLHLCAAQTGAEHHGPIQRYAQVQNPTCAGNGRSNRRREEGGTAWPSPAEWQPSSASSPPSVPQGPCGVRGERLRGTIRLMIRVLFPPGLHFDFVDTRDPEAIRGALRPETRLVFLETPSNPLMRLTDLLAAASITREAGVLLCVDNTSPPP